MFIGNRGDRFENDHLNFSKTIEFQSNEKSLSNDDKRTDEDEVNESKISQRFEFHFAVQRNNKVERRP